MRVYSYFSRAAGEFRDRMQRYAATIGEIHRQLGSIEQRDEHSPQAIDRAIAAQYQTFMTLTGKVAALHHEIEQLKADYTRWYQQNHQTARDPFALQPSIGV